ncbi:BIR protein [Plasmodium berghei]|uniref:BIR protein n=2 Tax=Plasmodium berghei TaxID=5821 RepID=A0A509AMQ8_PLABA|nr:BIR protein [Plasmodium berghei ANKA]CXI84731.1 BIR protein [Plasmodium berghei]SBW38228.1 BIR protein [Plasmodium berghei]SCL82819.1 BIR protein [Plasmodium berghei]SCL83813.1 BIR protein [Plasmodium berghei]SCL84406.1 BIR protein [Plasmodium berghei]|eukprot:XP_034423143.1 BIR protein [Plasmodium berghei ANKA]
MNDDLCQNFDLLRMHLPDELTEKAKLNFNDDSDFKNYCPNGSCNTDLEKITAGFLWLLGQYFTKYSKKGHIVNDIKPFFLYIILWLSYKLNQNSEHKTNQINDFYTNHVINSGKYNSFTSAAYKFTDLKEFIDGQKDLFNINIKDLSKFYDASKLICSMYGKVAQNKTSDTLSNAASFVNKYTTLNNDCNIKGTVRSKIFSTLSTDYDNIKNECKDAQCSNFPILPAIKATQNATKGSKQASETISVTNSVKTSAQTFEVTSSSSSIGNKLFTVLSIFGAIAFLLGISYKYSLFGFRKRAQKQYLREKIKNIKKRMNH